MKHVLTFAALLVLCPPLAEAARRKPGCLEKLESGKAVFAAPPQLAPGIFVKPEFMVGLQAQASLQATPELKLDLPRSRVTSVAWIRLPDSETIVTTSEHANKELHFFSPDGTLLKELGRLHEKEGAVWSPDIVAVDKTHGFIVTEGGPTPHKLIDVARRKVSGTVKFRNYGSASGSSSADYTAYALIQFVNEGRHLLLVSQGGTINILRLNAKTRKFALQSVLLPVIKTGLLATLVPVRGNVSTAQLTPDGNHIWLAYDSGPLLKYPVSELLEMSAAGSQPLEALVTPEALNPSFQSNGTYVAGIRFSPDSRDAWLAVETYFSDMTPDLRYRSDPTKLNLVKYDAASMEPLLAKEAVFMGSKLEDLYVTADRVILIARAPESAIAFLDSKGTIGARWTLERGGLKHYLSGSSGPHDPIHSSTLSEDGEVLVTGHDGASVALWDTRRGALLAVTEAESGDIRTVKFSPDQRSLFVGAHLGVGHVYGVQDLIDEAGILPRLKAGEGKP